MFACLHGVGDLAALAFEFSPVVERTTADTVTLDVAGLERLFGPAQDVAAAIARRAAERGARANVALASNPDAAICAARRFPGVGPAVPRSCGRFRWGAWPRPTRSAVPPPGSPWTPPIR